jgi:hypothetical protein
MTNLCVVAYPSDPTRKRRVWEGGGGPFLRLEVALADGDVDHQDQVVDRMIRGFRDRTLWGRVRWLVRGT